MEMAVGHRGHSKPPAKTTEKAPVEREHAMAGQRLCIATHLEPLFS